MAIYRFKTKEELIRDSGIHWRHQHPSWNEHMEKAIGRPMHEVFNEDEIISALSVMERKVNDTDDYENWFKGVCRVSESDSRWSWNTSWFVRIAGIDVILIQQGEKQVAKGSLYKHNEKFYLVERITKLGRNVTLNDMHDLMDCEIIDNEIQKELT